MIGKWVTIICGVFFGLWLFAAFGFWMIQERVLFSPDPSPLAPAPDGVQTLELTTSDGETLLAYYAEAVREECPTILFLNNNEGRIDRETHRVEAISEQGLGILLVSWRGYAGSTGSPSEQGFHLDARAGWDWLVTEGALNADQIIIHGHSIGTGPATKLAGEVDPAALVLEAPYFSILDMVSQRIPVLPMSLILKHPFRTDEWIGDVQSPILIAHGLQDVTIKPSQSERLVQLAQTPIERWMSGEADHFNLATHGLYDEALAEFLETHNLGC